MRKLAEIRKDLVAKIAEVKGIDARSPENSEALQKGLAEIKTIQDELEAAERVEAAEQRTAAQEFASLQKKSGRAFSILKFFREAGDKSLSGIEKDVADMGADEYERLGVSREGTVLPLFALRAADGQNYTVAADGGELIETAAARYMAELRDKMVVTKLGAHLLTGLIGEVPVISSSDLVAGWNAEAAEATISKIQFGKKKLQMHRNFVAGAVTKDLLRQTSLDVERMLLEKLQYAHMSLLEAAAINGTGANSQPTGILGTAGIGSVAIGANGGPLTWAKIVALETKINSDNANRGRLGYWTNAKVWGALKSVEKFTGGGRAIIDDPAAKMLNGYPIEWSNIVPSNGTKGTGTNLSTLVFGNFDDLWIGQWGGLDLVIDPFTKALSAQIRYILHAWNDVLVVEPKSFAAITDIVAE